MIKRQGIIVYLYYNRDLRKIAKFGDVVYHSYKMRYVHLYVDEDKVEDILKELDGMKAVKKVLPSYYSDIDMDFVGVWNVTTPQSLNRLRTFLFNKRKVFFFLKSYS